MKIGIDASLVVGEKAGVGWYTASLIEALARIDHRNQYILYPFFYHIFDPRFKKLVAPTRSFSVRFTGLPEALLRYLWFHSRIPRHRLLGKVDVLHSTTFCCPPVHSGQLVVTMGWEQCVRKKMLILENGFSNPIFIKIQCNLGH